MPLHVTSTSPVALVEAHFWAFSSALSQDYMAAESRFQGEFEKTETEITVSYLFIFSTVSSMAWRSASIARHTIRMAITATA
jgi:hypothetical protein